MHDVEGGGSFGRHLFADAAFEAAAVSKAMGKPVKLMWHRTDNFRQGRVHPMATSRVRIVHLGRERARVRPAPHERRHGLHPRASASCSSAKVATLPSDEPARLLAGGLQPDRERAVQLRRSSPSCSTRSTTSTRSTRRPSATSTARTCCTAVRADGRRAREGDGQGPVPVPARVRPGRPPARGARQGRRGGQLGPRDAGRHRAGDRAPPRVQGLLPRASSRSTAGPQTVNRQVRARLHGPAGDEGRLRGRRRAADQPARPRRRR